MTLFYCCNSRSIITDLAETSSGHFQKYIIHTQLCMSNTDHLPIQKRNINSWQKTHRPVSPQTKVGIFMSHKVVFKHIQCSQSYNKCNTATVWGDSACTPSTPRKPACVCVHSHSCCKYISVHPCFMSQQPSIVHTRGRLVEGGLWTTLSANEGQAWRSLGQW